MKILISSDLHLSLKTWKYKNIIGDSYFALVQLRDMVLKHKVDSVILAGDILNSIRPHSTDLYVARNIFREIDVPVYTIHGEHDISYPSWHEFLGDNIRPFYFDKLELGNRKFAMISKCPPDEFYVHVNETYKDCEIIICHQLFKDIFPIAGNIELSKLRDGFYITGDLHQHIYKEFGNKRLLSIGGTHYRKISECHDFYAIILDTESLEFERVKFKTRGFYKITIPVDCKKQNVLNFIFSEMEKFKLSTPEIVIGKYKFCIKPIVVIKYPKDIPINTISITDQFPDVIFFFDVYGIETDFNLGLPDLNEHEEFDEVKCLEEIVPRDHDLFPLIHGLLTKEFTVDDVALRLSQKYNINLPRNEIS